MVGVARTSVGDEEMMLGVEFKVEVNSLLLTGLALLELEARSVEISWPDVFDKITEIELGSGRAVVVKMVETPGALVIVLLKVVK